MKLLVTGGAGFIGSNFVRYLLDTHPDDSVVVLDKLTYAGRRENFKDLEHNANLSFVAGDICDPSCVEEVAEECDAILNFAAESHVDRSIDQPGGFIQTDVYGTFVLLDAAVKLGVERYLQISTDEVYGSIKEGSFTELSPLEPSSPYSASKSGGDLLVKAYCQTYKLDAVITRSSNNYGPFQYPEKLIPLCILNALAGDPLPIYGDGRQIRNWLHVADNCRAIDTALRKGVTGEIYNIGGDAERENLDVVTEILRLTERDQSLVEFVKDRAGHDQRYSLESEKVRSLGWSPSINFERGLEETVDWYRNNEWWWQPIRSGEYRDFYQHQYGTALK